MDYHQSQILGQEIACAIENGIKNAFERLRNDRRVELIATVSSNLQASRPSCAESDLVKIASCIVGLAEKELAYFPEVHEVRIFINPLSWRAVCSCGETCGGNNRKVVDDWKEWHLKHVFVPDDDVEQKPEPDYTNPGRPHYFDRGHFTITSQEPCIKCGKPEDDDLHTPF